MKVEVLNHTNNAVNIIAEIGGICYDTKFRDEEHKRTLVKSLINRGHESVLEHASITFLIDGVSRALTHQLVRHRMASYTQQSQRYCKVNTEGKDWYINPYKESSSEAELFDEYMKLTAIEYETLLKTGKKEDARAVLPNSTATKIVVTMNIRGLRNFFKLRLHKSAQKEIRELAEKMLSKCEDLGWDILFQDIKEEIM